MRAGDMGVGFILGMGLGVVLIGAVMGHENTMVKSQCEVASRLDHLSNNVEDMALSIERGMSVSQCKELIVKLGLESAEDADDARMWEK